MGYDKTKKKVIPWCFRITRLRPGRKFCRVGRLATEVGWKYGELVKKLEEKRNIRGKAFHEIRRPLSSSGGRPQPLPTSPRSHRCSKSTDMHKQECGNRLVWTDASIGIATCSCYVRRLMKS